MSPPRNPSIYEIFQEGRRTSISFSLLSSAIIDLQYSRRSSSDNRVRCFPLRRRQGTKIGRPLSRSNAKRVQTERKGSKLGKRGNTRKCEGLLKKNRNKIPQKITEKKSSVNSLIVNSALTIPYNTTYTYCQ